MNENAEGYFLTRDAMRWFYGHYLNDPSRGRRPARVADPSRRPRRAAAGVRDHRASTTRCATRASRTPTRCAPRATTSR